MENVPAHTYRDDALTSWPIVGPSPLQRKASGQGERHVCNGVADDLVLSASAMAAEMVAKRLRVDARPAPYTVESQAAFFLENLWSARRTRIAYVSSDAASCLRRELRRSSCALDIARALGRGLLAKFDGRGGVRRRAGMQSRGARGLRGVGGLTCHWPRSRGKNFTPVPSRDIYFNMYKSEQYTRARVTV